MHYTVCHLFLSILALGLIYTTALMPLLESNPSVSPLNFSWISECPFSHQPHFSISGVRKGQGVKSLFQYYIFSTLLPVFWENWGSFAAGLSVYIFFTRLYWNYNCVLWRLLLVPCSVWRSCGPGEMKKNGPLLRDSITEEENAAAYWPFFSSPLSVFLQVPISGDARYYSRNGAEANTTGSTHWEIISFCN